MPESYIVAENRYKQKLLLNPNDLIGKAILQHGIYDKTGLYFIEKILSKLKPAIIFDVGANIGNHALRMSQFCETIYLFEPQVEVADCLHKTANLNQLQNWKVLNIGLSDKEETLTFYKNLDSNIESSFVAQLKGKNCVAQEASVCIGDEVVNQYGINRLDFMKIDVEGFEAKVILGLKGSIQKFRPLIFMEWDKQITKDQFSEYQLFENVFIGYSMRAIIRNPEESSLPKKLIGKICRLMRPGAKRKRHIIGEFLPQHDYRHIVLVPTEKMQLLTAL